MAARVRTPITSELILRLTLASLRRPRSSRLRLESMEPTTINAPLKGRYSAIPFIALGTAAIVFGGLFSAATARSATYHSAWFVAYLVLIVGFAQVALGIGQWWLASKPVGIATVIAEVIFFTIGNAGVIVGTLLAAPFWVDAGSIWFVIALALFSWKVWSPRRGGVALWGYWTLMVVLALSVIVGIYFAHSR